MKIAAERLRESGNVECRFGDSLLLLPELVEAGDVVLIDGPKDFRALKLAFRLLRGGKPWLSLSTISGSALPRGALSIAICLPHF